MTTPVKAPQTVLFESARDRLGALGAFLGWLGFMQIDPGHVREGEWKKIVTDCSGFKRMSGKPPTEGQVVSLTQIMKEAYRRTQEGLAGHRTPSEPKDCPSCSQHLAFLTEEERRVVHTLFRKSASEPVLERYLQTHFLPPRLLDPKKTDSP